MSGSRIGGLKTKQLNLERDPDFYRKIGSIGGKISKGGGFASKTICTCSDLKYSHIKAECAGARGGRISRRAKRV